MKRTIEKWETVAVYVATYPDDNGEGACDVEVQIGLADDGLWYVQTRDDAGGSDDGPYGSRAEAKQEAADFAYANNDACEGEDAEEYLHRILVETRGEEDPKGEWCIYWATALDDSGPRERYATRDQAQAAMELAEADLAQAYPGGNLLCGFQVRCLSKGQWILPDDE